MEPNERSAGTPPGPTSSGPAPVGQLVVVLLSDGNCQIEAQNLTLDGIVDVLLKVAVNLNAQRAQSAAAAGPPRRRILLASALPAGPLRNGS